MWPLALNYSPVRMFRRAARRIRSAVRALLVPTRREGGPRRDPVRGRRRALNEEVAYWQQWVTTQGGRWPDEFAYRFDPDAEVEDPALREVLERLPGTHVSVVDVGAGPASHVGQRYGKKVIDLWPLDPLADKYDRLLDRAGTSPPVRTKRGTGERLVEQFGRDRFHVAYARNALDHAVEPVLIITQMLHVVRPGGWVVLRHVLNEAERQRYRQLHQWNFEERAGDLIVWREGREISLRGVVDPAGDVTCYTEPSLEPGVDNVVCLIEKRAAAAPLDVQ